MKVVGTALACGAGYARQLFGQQLSDILAGHTAATRPNLRLLDCLAKRFFLRLGKSLWAPAMGIPATRSRPSSTNYFSHWRDRTRRDA